jgi:L,D-transpeptidase YcbB
MQTPIFNSHVLYMRIALLCSAMIFGCACVPSSSAKDLLKTTRPSSFIMKAAYKLVPNHSTVGIIAIAATEPDKLPPTLIRTPETTQATDLNLPAFKIPALVDNLNPRKWRLSDRKIMDMNPLASIETARNLPEALFSNLISHIEPQNPSYPEKPAEDPLRPESAMVSSRPITEILRQAVEGWEAQPVAHADDHKLRNQVAAFYAARNYEPLWSNNGQWTVQSHGALARVERAGEDGLDLGTMSRPVLGPDSAKLAENELLLTDLVVHYAAQAMGSRINPTEISKLITAKPATPDFADILTHIAAADDANNALQAANPPQKAYADLRLKLAELRREVRPMVQTSIPTGPVLKIGMKDPRVPLIRERFGLAIEPNIAGQDIVYDTRVAAAVADFQSIKGLPPSGTLTPRTIAALSGGEPASLEAELVANMEIWRWVPRDMGHDRIEVNLTEFAARLYRDDKSVYTTKVVVGKPTTPTPVFSNRMQFLIVNPYWNVPLSIVKKEMMPKLAEDPDYFAKHGYQLVQHGHLTYVRQPPGDANALGRIKFMFPNEHSVYMHDTPSKSFFARDVRAFSHGCVRVDQPFRFAEAVLGQGWTEEKVRKLIGGQERTINLPESLPIHILYFTTNVDDKGKLQIRDDLYGYMKKVKLQLGLSG